MGQAGRAASWRCRLLCGFPATANDAGYLGSRRVPVKYPETLSSLNPLFCMALLLVPVIGAWSALREHGNGHAAIAAAFGLLMLSQHLRGGDSIAWFVGWYALGTLGEGADLPLGMDLVTSLVLAVTRLLTMSLWLFVDVSRRLSCRARIGAHRGS